MEGERSTALIAETRILRRLSSALGPLDGVVRFEEVRKWGGWHKDAEPSLVGPEPWKATVRGGVRLSDAQRHLLDDSRYLKEVGFKLYSKDGTPYFSVFRMSPNAVVFRNLASSRPGGSF